MQQSTSYRANRYTVESRRNFNTVPYPTPVQQQQIQDLEQKVDVILLHNNKLIEQNVQLKRLLQLAQIRVTQTRHSAMDSTQFYRMKRQLQIKTLELNRLNSQTIQQKHSIRQQFDDLNSVVKTLTNSNQRLSIQKQQLQLKISNLVLQKQKQIQLIKQQLQNQIYENSLKKEIEHKEQLREKQSQFNKKFEKKQQEWQDEKNKIEEQKMNTIINMEQNMQKEKQEMRKQIQNTFNNTIKKIKDEADQKCRKVRDDTEKYIKTILDQHKQDTIIEGDSLKKQIQSLKQSLQERQLIIQDLFKVQNKTNETNPSFFNQVISLKKRIKQLTQSFFKQSELLKVKMAIKHQVDVRQTAQVYEGKIQVLTYRINMLQDQNAKLRQKYQDQIRSKMKQRQKFEIQVSRLKNLIRKMKIELQSYGKQMRLNIQGIRDQANSFSMSILGELGQQKSKKGFYEQQIRKMRQIIQLKDKETQTLTLQGEQKIKYFEQKLNFAKHSINQLSEQLENKDDKFKQQIDAQRQAARDELKKQKIFWLQQQQDLKIQIMDLRLLKNKIQINLKQSESQNRSLEKQLEQVSQQLKSCKQHIEALKLQIQTLGQESKEQERNALKKHYERIVEQLQKDKENLKQTNATQTDQIAKLVGKYKLLQKSMEKTFSTIKKKTDLQVKVVQLGMDNNLVKNLGQIFRKQNKENSQNK